MSESDDDDDFDEEILEIFVEEAGEVSDAIAEYFPQCAADFENQEALTEFRRAFHTLKGSGRMVGANDIGELAWSIENMLNRILDGTIAPGDQHVAAIEQVRRSEEHTSELQSRGHLVCRLLLEKKKNKHKKHPTTTQ